MRGEIIKIKWCFTWYFEEGFPKRPLGNLKIKKDNLNELTFSHVRCDCESHFVGVSQSRSIGGFVRPSVHPSVYPPIRLSGCPSVLMGFFLCGVVGVVRLCPPVRNPAFLVSQTYDLDDIMIMYHDPFHNTKKVVDTLKALKLISLPFSLTPIISSEWYGWQSPIFI